MSEDLRRCDRSIERPLLSALGGFRRARAPALENVGVESHFLHDGLSVNRQLVDHVFPNLPHDPVSLSISSQVQEFSMGVNRRQHDPSPRLLCSPHPSTGCDLSDPLILQQRELSVREVLRRVIKS